MDNLSLKYRPQTFEEMVGQKEALDGLRTYLTQSDSPQSILLTGPRGTGKTSTARLIVKALNCQEEDSEKRPCGKCDVCQAIANGTLVDMYELDGATNRGIDSVREIIDLAYHSPIYRVKCFIIDEVHMFTREASNALLKILEEPPKGVLFVLCTTEEHKLLPTVKSRLKIYRFRLIDAPKVREVLTVICEGEGIEFSDPNILDFIVAEGGGSLRDAIRTLDQVRELGNAATMEQVLENVGLASSEQVGEFVGAIIVKDLVKAFQILDAVNKSSEIVLFYQQLLDYLQQLLYIQLGLDVGRFVMPAQMTEQGGDINEHWVLSAIKCFTQWAKQINPITRLGLEGATVEFILGSNDTNKPQNPSQTSSSVVSDGSTLSFIKSKMNKKPETKLKQEDQF